MGEDTFPSISIFAYCVTPEGAYLRQKRLL
jgi:hypothetical protein